MSHPEFWIYPKFGISIKFEDYSTGDINSMTASGEYDFAYYFHDQKKNWDIQ